MTIMLEQERLWEHDMGPRHPDPLMPPELPVVQLSHVLLGTLVWWLESEKQLSPKQMATWFHRFAFYGYLAALGYQRNA